MTAISVRDLGRVSFPGGEGIFSMLACYLDDSGTHLGSKAMVWGGLIGHIDLFAKLESVWKLTLQSPCEGRPPIKAFHSSHLAAGECEFEGYSYAERDLTRYNFRKSIVDSGVTAIAFAVSVDDWDRIITGRVREFFGNPERWICGESIHTGCDIARKYSLPISFQFDIERKNEGVDLLIRIATEDAAGLTVNVGFSQVTAVLSLQAADMVAHQTYQHFLKTRIDPKARPNAHMLRLMEGAHDWGVKVFTTDAMREMVRVATPLLEQYDEQMKRIRQT